MENNFFKPGDVVVINKEIDNKPKRMLVIGKQNNLDDKLIGITCLFFDSKGQPFEYLFNTKDISLYVEK